MQDRTLRTTFDGAANIYDIRPSYPEEIIEEIISFSGISKESCILEIGVGTGQITLPFAKRGYEMVGLELGPALAERARQNLQEYPNVEIVTTAFEDWQSQDKFDLLLSAQAFHWIETDIGLEKALTFLHDTGALALVWTLDESHEKAFYKETTPIFDKYIPVQPHRPTPNEGYTRYKQALVESSAFGEVMGREVTWNQTYSKEDFLKLQDTQSNHRLLSEETRAEFHRELSKVIDLYGGSVVRLYRTVLLFAKRLSI
jgi:cyclopropane fatty-acyl-phospholipid synthase-like methyltransferase